MKNKVACCYLTHEHPEVIDEILEKICKPYGDRGIDIYIFDSSESDDTRVIVEKYAQKGLCNLCYVPMQHTKGRDGGNEKYLYILKGYGLKGRYDYIWPTKDRCRFEGDTLDEICRAIEEGHDVILGVDERDRYELIKRQTREVYTDPVAFFGDYGALSTNWECLIRRVDTMLEPIDWDRYGKEYGVGLGCNFNQTLTTFVRLSEMDKCSVRVNRAGIEDRKSTRLNSSH